MTFKVLSGTAALSFAGVGLHYCLSDSRSSFYKQALIMGQVVTANDAEFAHKAAVVLAKYSIVPRDKVGNDNRLSVNVWGLLFPNPIGLAAGFDKNAECMNSMLSNGLGFGFTEVGSITPKPQSGNPLPRVFRLSLDKAIINRYGFNSDGMEVVSRNLDNYHTTQNGLSDRVASSGLLGVNLGKNKMTEDALSDYSKGVRNLAQYADYMVINISSPNTPGLRDLQGKEKLHALISGVQKELLATVTASDYTSRHRRNKKDYCPPLLIKISPDMSDVEMSSVADVALELKIDGIIISNTTIRREQLGLLESTDVKNESGGLSGKPLLTISNQALSKMYKLTKGKVPLIGVGGVSSAEDVYQKMKLGASLVQLYTSLVYEGPGLPASIKEELLELLKRDGHENIESIIGLDHSISNPLPPISLPPSGRLPILNIGNKVDSKLRSE